MNFHFEHRFKQLYKQLLSLGYYPFQVRNMVQEAIGCVTLDHTNDEDRVKLVNALEKYVELGSDYLVSYSK